MKGLNLCRGVNGNQEASVFCQTVGQQRSETPFGPLKDQHESMCILVSRVCHCNEMCVLEQTEGLAR